jgi:hypothetical protein
VGNNGTTTEIAYSSDGILWTAVASPSSVIFTTAYGVAWNGIRFVAVGSDGSGGNEIAYSFDGIIWYAVVSPSSTIFTTGYGVAGNPKIGATIVPSQLIIDKNSINQTNTLDLASGSYYNSGPTHVSVTINSLAT